MEITLLSCIRPFKYNYRIRVRVCRTWRAIRFGAEKFDRLHCVLVDEQGSSVHAFMPENQVEDMIEKPLQGQMYDIHQFSTKQHCYGLRVVENSVQIHFNGHTVFCRGAETVPAVLTHSFRLIEFEHLEAERESQAIASSQGILTDVYGCIKSIRPPHPQYIRSQNKTGVKCEIVLENLRRQTLTIVFWGKLAREFDEHAVTELRPPVLAVFTGLKMAEYKHRVVGNNYDHTCVLLNPQTSQTDAYKTEFSRPGDKTEIQGDFHVFQSKEPTEIISVQKLTGLNPAEHRAKSVFCKGLKIGSDGWWYRRCPEGGCYKQCFKMEELDNKYSCKTHGHHSGIPCFRVNTLIGDEFSDVTVTVMGNQAEQLFGCKLETLRSKHVYITEQTVPPEISAAIGEVHTFEVKANAYGEWIMVSIAAAKEDSAITLPGKEAATSSATVIPELTLQTPEKSCTEKKREGEKVQRTLFADDKKARRETEETSTSSSTINEKEKLD